MFKMIHVKEAKSCSCLAADRHGKLEAQSIIVNNSYSVVWDVCLNTIDTVYAFLFPLNCSSEPLESC